MEDPRIGEARDLLHARQGLAEAIDREPESPSDPPTHAWLDWYDTDLEPAQHSFNFNLSTFNRTLGRTLGSAQAIETAREILSQLSHPEGRISG